MSDELELPTPELIPGSGVVVDQVTLAFYTPVLAAMFDEHERVNAPLLAALREIALTEGLTDPRASGTGSTANLLGRALPGLDELVEFFYGALDHTLHVANAGLRGPPELELPDNYAEQAELIELWASFVAPGDHVRPHMHPQATWVGIYHLDVGDAEREHGGELVLHNPAPAAAYTDTTLHLFASQAMSLWPTDGTLVLFPGYMTHAVGRHEGRRSRVTLVFNFRMTDGGFAASNRRLVPVPVKSI